jgi:hypothetical protein
MDTQNLGKFPFPNELAHPRIKADKFKWGIPLAKAIWSAAQSNNGPNAFYKKRLSYEKALKLAFGEQDENKYKPFLGISPKEEKNWVTAIDWKNKNYATKIIRIVTEKLRSLEYEANVDTIDPVSVDLKKNLQGKIKAIMAHQQFLQEMSDFVKQNLMGMNPEDIPLNDEDAEVSMELNYKDRLAVEIEDGIKYHLSRNDWQYLKEQADFDLTVFNSIVLCVHNDIADTIEIERVYPGNAILPESDNPYFTGLKYASHILYPTISELKAMAGEELSNEDIEEIFKKHSIGEFAKLDTTRSDVLDYRDTRRTRVLFFRYSTTNEIVNLEYTDQGGNRRFVEKDYDYYKTIGQQKKFQNKYPDRSLYRTPVTVIYEGYWVIGSDYMFKYGQKANTYYKKNNGKLGEPQLGYVIVNADYFEGRSVSLMEHLEPTLDALEILDKRIQKELSTPFPQGVKIDLKALKDVKFKFQGKVLEMGDIIEMAIQQKVFIVDTSGSPNMPGGQEPVQGLQSPGVDLQDLLALMQQKLQELDRLIGLNDASSANQVSAEQGARVTQMQMLATDTALGSFYRASRFSFLQTAKILAGYHLLAIKADETGKYDAILGSDSTDFIRNIDDVDLGVTIEAKMSKEEWNQFYAEISRAVDRGAISESDRIALKRFHSLKKAEAYMRAMERRRERAAQQAQQQQIEANAQVQMQSSQQADQGKAMLENIKNEGKKNLAMIEAFNNKDRLTSKNQDTVLNKNLDARNKLMAINVEGEEDRQTEVVKSKNKPEPAKH